MGSVLKMGMVVLIEFSFTKSLKQRVPGVKIIGTQLVLSGIPEVITSLAFVSSNWLYRCWSVLLTLVTLMKTFHHNYDNDENKNC